MKAILTILIMIGGIVALVGIIFAVFSLKDFISEKMNDKTKEKIEAAQESISMVVAMGIFLWIIIFGLVALYFAIYNSLLI